MQIRERPDLFAKNTDDTIQPVHTLATRRIPGLDELRGIAILLVSALHFAETIVLHLGGPPRPMPVWVPWSSIGVDLFFVISGCLITRILVSTRGVNGYFQIFYARRALRILPLAIMAILVSYLVASHTRHLVWVNVFFLTNYYQAMAGIPQLWSLAVEEQFYLIFPAICAFIRPNRLWMPILGCFVLFFACHSLGIYTGNYFPPNLYTAEYRTHARAYVIALGAWIALESFGLVTPRRSAIVQMIICGVLAVAALTGRVSVLEVVVMPLLYAAVSGAVSERIVLRNRALRWLGVRCYGIYLLHFGLIAALMRSMPYGLVSVGPTATVVAVTVAYVSLTIALAAISYRYFERPLLRLAPNYPLGDTAKAPVMEMSIAVDT